MISNRYNNNLCNPFSRVYNVFKHWMNNAFYDFSNDTELLATLQSFIKKDMKPTLENPAINLEGIIEKKVQFVFLLFLLNYLFVNDYVIFSLPKVKKNMNISLQEIHLNPIFPIILHHRIRIIF